MHLNNFTDRHFPEAVAISLVQWRSELKGLCDHATEALIYEYFVDFYYRRNSQLNMAVTDDDGKLLAFLLAFIPKDDGHEAAAATRILAKATDANRQAVAGYIKYLEDHGREECEALDPGDAIVGIFVSTKPGCGRMLLEEFHRRCKANDVHGYVLWTDESCDFDYYHKHGYSEVAHYPYLFPITSEPVDTYIFRKKVN